MPIQFDYPQNGWSTGKMRKRGQKPYAPDFEHAFAATAPKASEMTPAQQVFERSRPELGESASGKAVPTPSDETMDKMAFRGIGKPAALAASIIQQHRTQLEDGLQQLSDKSITLSMFKKLMSKLGWSGDHSTGQFTDPNGEQHDLRDATVPTSQ